MNLKQSLLLLSGMIMLKLAAVSQTSTTAFTPKIIPPSPNAASIAKFGDIPVSPYTGTTDISVPFYTIRTKSISVPVSVDYHTGGIRLSEESGLVGLGWALNAGGMISRTVNDKDDFDGAYFDADLVTKVPEVKGKLVYHTASTALEQFTNGLQNPMTYTPVGMGIYGYDFGCRYTVYSSDNNYNFFPVFNTGTVYQDMEPDQYTFNFPGGSGKFIIARDGKVVLQKQENLKIEYAQDGAWFAITDEHGNKFYFFDIELSQPAIGGAFTKSSWLLSKVVTQQKDSVMFSYSSDNTWTTVKGIGHETFRTGCSGFEGVIYSNDVGQTYLNKTLDSITWANGQIQFEYDAIRADLQNGKKLNTVKIYNKDQSGLHYQKENRLYYGYFNNTASDALEFKRLRLDSVKEISGTTFLPPYIFAYNMPATMQNLLGKHYSSVDHWGYFNGKSNAVSGDYAKGFTAPFTGIVNIGDNYSGNINIPQYLSLTGANREADSSFMKAFVLNQVNYPTGGFTSLEYDPNYYDYDSSKGLSGSKDFEYVKTISKVVQVTVNNNGTYTGTVDFSDIYLTSNLASNANLTVSFRAANSDSLNYYHNSLGYGKINFVFQSNTTDISNSSLQCSGTKTGANCSGTVYSLSIPLTIASATIYSWTGYIDPKVKISSGFMDITATFTYLIPEYKTKTIMMAGGLRIKSVTDYAANGTLAKKRTYDYGYQQDRNTDGTNESYSYGRLMGYISYARYEPVIITIHNPPQPDGQFLCRNLSRYSSNFSGFTSLSSGNIVGYDQVTEYTIDPSNNDDNGKTVYTYYNSSDTSFGYGGFRLPGVNNLPNNLNGLLKSKTNFRDIGKVYSKISESNYYYHCANRVLYNAPKYSFYWGIGNAVRSNTGCPLGIDSLTTPLITCFYPAISSEKVLLDSTVEKLYDQSDINKVIINKSYNYYDNTKHYQLTRSKTTDSKSNTHVTFIKYPQDFITSGNYTTNTILDSLIGRNMVAEAIEKRDSLYYAGSSTGYITGAQLSKYRFLNANVLGLDKQYQLSVAAPVTNFQPFAISGNTTSQDSRYRQMVSFDTYDNNYNILQFAVPNQSAASFIYDYNNQYPVAQIAKATSDQVAYTSFESDGKGNWNNYTGAITTVTASPFPPTGNKYYNLTTSAILSKTVTIGKSYIISYWSKNGIYSITGGGTPTNTTGKTINSWTYYEQKVTATLSTITLATVSGTGAIDEVRIYPSDAQMTTYTYDAFGNMLSACDMNSRITYYEYDEMQRLHVVRDQDRNVIKKICYNYAGQPSACEGKTYTNVLKSGSFQKQTCSPSYYIGSYFTYNVAANTYYSEISQADADQKAIDDVAANGQNFANGQTGGCSAPPMIDLKYTNSTPTSMTVKFTHKLSGAIYQFTLSANVTTQTTIGQIMQGGPYDVTVIPTSGSFLYNYQVYSYTQMNVHSFSYSDMPTICSTCATMSVSYQH
ncbi:hypothetical protein FRZ67_19010 [Panacibacter ginsenosidivorans]|uniref:DUF5977 domain-containing protein n=1 Tax=Panacibacter ginsenosidivorans TaxID=1813871 RepID=A0A5B8VCV9_9BACT|nr:DUF5977 domain-containing protein [Panacibacter ginsenosidivorans]QEC69294.1 hypothetical protein FRZ67_19010 [Panacibacter ginsenosidivorans]